MDESWTIAISIHFYTNTVFIEKHSENYLQNGINIFFSNFYGL
ncbi:hypothetical protein HMPREF9078_02166 [Capnocytophaga sp. oral taxon 380 str. F0488]|nr:hypothetical protein HMPREF9078_02166 [Capnocytophaga sp. oral taxon 380 str. F0488]